MSNIFSPESDSGRSLADWWQSLKQDTGSRAELRRCGEVSQVAMCPSFHRLCVDIRKHMQGERGWQDRVAAVAGLSSHLKNDAADSVLSKRGSVAQMMASKKGEGPVVSQLRFRRLLQRDRGDLYPAMIRILRMLDGRANIYDLATSVFYWGDEVKKRWAYTYFPEVSQTRK